MKLVGQKKLVVLKEASSFAEILCSIPLPLKFQNYKKPEVHQQRKVEHILRNSKVRIQATA